MVVIKTMEKKIIDHIDSIDASSCISHGSGVSDEYGN
jgi:hypothetical protein